MITVQDLFPDQAAAEAGDKRLTTWYAQGHSDGLGDRLLMFDNTNAPSWEILRFKPALAHEPRFEAALRQRVEQLASFQHDAFPLVRPIQRLGHEDGLAVVSTYSGGAALSEALKKPRGVDFALRVIRQLVPALAAFQRLGAGIAHGALTVDRIILNAEGRLMIREHMVGAALDSLDWSWPRHWSELGILVPKTQGIVRIDERTDIAQLALVVLSLMAGRRIGPDEYPDKTSELLDELTLKNHWLNPSNPAKFQSLRHWLERALQLTGQSFTSVQDAQAALVDLQEHADTRPGQPELPRTTSRAELKDESSSTMWSGASNLPLQASPPASSLPAPSPASPPIAVQEHRTASGEQASGPHVRAGKRWNAIRAAAVRWASVALALVVIVEAFIIAKLLSTPSAPATVERVAPAPPAPSHPDVQPNQPPSPAAVVPPVVGTVSADSKVPPVQPLQPPPPARTGGIRVSAPIELTVLDGERVIGSTADGPVITTAGQRELEFVNSAVGYRARHVVDVRAGQVTTYTVTVPNGTLNINALPWATVSINGKVVGETPLGNLSLVPGEHEVLFRHPQLGERREKAIVRPGAETRVAVNLQP